MIAIDMPGISEAGNGVKSAAGPCAEAADGTESDQSNQILGADRQGGG